MKNREPFQAVSQVVRIFPMGLLAMPPLTVVKAHFTPAAKVARRLPLPIPGSHDGTMHVCIECRRSYEIDGHGW